MESLAFWKAVNQNLGIPVTFSSLLFSSMASLSTPLTISSSSAHSHSTALGWYSPVMIFFLLSLWMSYIFWYLTSSAWTSWWYISSSLTFSIWTFLSAFTLFLTTVGRSDMSRAGL